MILMWEIVWCIRKNNLFTGRTGINKLEIICQTFGITLAEFFNDTDVLVSMTEEEKNMLSQWNLLSSCSENGCDKYYRSATVLWLNLPWTIAIWTSIFFFFQIFLKCSFIVHYTPCSCLFHSLAVYVCILKITKFCYLHENKRAFHNSLRVSA